MIKLLDHGYVKFIEAWGTGESGQCDRLMHRDERDYERGIIEAARQSTQGNFRGWDKDQKLLEYLYQHDHATPFEFAGMIIEVQAPIFVFREWHRHRTQSYNEMSARYASVPDMKYMPTMDRLMMVNEGSANKQAGNVGGILLTADNAMKWLSLVEHAYAAAAEAYRFGLAVGVEKGLARIPMPVGNYTRMRATANLRNWLAFLTLRMDPAAQNEIRQYAYTVGSLIGQHFPRTWSQFRLEQDSQ
jgi:thymidylate synthase (FAD)